MFVMGSLPQGNNVLKAPLFVVIILLIFSELIVNKRNNGIKGSYNLDGNLRRLREWWNWRDKQQSEVNILVDENV